MKLEELNKAIRSGNLCGIYLFYGEEQFLLENKLEKIKNKIITSGTEAFNLFKFEGKGVSSAEILQAVDQFPQMSPMKLVIVKNTGLLNNAALTDFKRLRDAAEHIPSDTCLVFIEQSFDKKKLKNIDFIEQNGGIVNFEYIPLSKLEIWILETFKKAEKSILEKDARYLLRLCGQSLGKISIECDKLISYTGDRLKVTAEDIDAVVDKTAEYRIYEMLDSVIEGRREKAHEQLKYLRDTREEPFYVLGLMMTRLSELLMCKLLNEEGLPRAEIGTYFDFKKPDFAVTKTINESKRFGEKYLKAMIDKGLFYDIECKQGRLSPWTAVEMYLADLTKK